MTLDSFKILYKLSPPWLNDLVVVKNSKYSFKDFNIVEVPRVKTTTMLILILNIQLLFYGMTYQMKLEKWHILTNLKTFYNHEMAMHVNVIHEIKLYNKITV
jgi:hypothetical protein